MRRLLRWTFNALAMASLLLCLATAVLWVRSYWVNDQLYARRPDASGHGRVHYGCFVWSDRGRLGAPIIGRHPRSRPVEIVYADVYRAVRARFVLREFGNGSTLVSGVGPDNDRLQYGKYLGARRWDTHVYSNNLYLEILTGSGILGLEAASARSSAS